MKKYRIKIEMPQCKIKNLVSGSYNPERKRLEEMEEKKDKMQEQGSENEFMTPAPSENYMAFRMAAAVC